MAKANRICGEQDCEESTNRPSHPLCYIDYLDLLDGLIDECPNHVGVYKPAKYDTCRECYFQDRTASEKTLESSRTRVGSDAKGWDTPNSEAKVVSRYAKAVERVRRNMTNHRKECTNHESNTIQYLVRPMLSALGWDFEEPKQVREEFRPKADPRRGKRGKAVDIALFENETPKVFVEAKRLDQRDDTAFMKQLQEYASHMDEGTAVLTNGRRWIIFPVLGRSLQGQSIIDLSQGDPEQVGEKLYSAIGRDTHEKGNGKSVRLSDIKDGLCDYRLRESRRRNMPAYTVFTDKTIELIASQKPNSLEELEMINGVGPATLQEHGIAILKIVRG